MSGTVLVAGATSVLGRHVARTLHARGWTVKALARDPARLRPLDGILSGVLAADALRRDTLRGGMHGVDVLFSCVGASVMPTLTPRAGFWSVDLPAHENLLDEALLSGVSRVVYVSVHHNAALRQLDYVAAHEAVVQKLRASGLACAIVRPTGFFSALGVLFDMARRFGVVPEIGDGRARSNPIADEDLAVVCADAVEGGPQERSAGGPEVLTRRQMAEAAFEALGKAPRVLPVPLWWARMNAAMLRRLHPRVAHLTAFFAAIAEHDLVGDVRGERTLAGHFRSMR